jgi:hypothetical protein
MSHYTDWYDGPDPGDWKEWKIDPPKRWEYDDDSIFRHYIDGVLQWVSRDKKKYLVQNMETSHILNCMRIPLYRNKENWDKIFRFELEIVRKYKI